MRRLGWLATGALALAVGTGQSARAHSHAAQAVPDWTGFWELYDIGATGTPSDAAVSRTMAKLHGGADTPDFTPAFQRRIATDAKEQLPSDRVCAFGFPWLMESSPLIFEVVADHAMTALLFNDNEIRRIYTDGGGHTPDDIIIASPSGDSVGHWEGDTLVVDTIASQSRIWVMDHGTRKYISLSDDADYRERIRKIGPDALEDTITATDRQALARPWTLVRTFRRTPHMQRVSIEQDCGAQNDRNPVINGQTTFLPGP